jgi:diguanylate cyclase (GGDEF)-like protein
MRLMLPAWDRSARQEFPGELYIGFVDNLLVEVRSLFLACTASVAAAVVAAVVSRSISLWVCAGLMLLLSSIRMHFQLLHAKNRPSQSVEAARLRERIFVAGATAHMALLSTWTLVAFVVTDEGFVRFLAATVTVPYAFGMWTRSFALDRGMNAQIVVAFVPLSAALLVGGGWYPLLIVICLLPLFLFIKSSSNRLKGIFRAEIAARNRSVMLAERLDTALNNMSHGLCMIDRQGRLILANEKFHRIFRLPVDAPLDGTHARALFRQLVRSRSIDEANLVPLSYAVFGKKSDGSDIIAPLETPDGRAIEVTIHKMKDDTTVMVIQDVTERRNAQREINRMARFDPVTELPNRRCFEEELAHALHPERQLAAGLTVMFLDLDDFKQVNDSLGHRTGDKLLVEIARRLRAIIGPRDLVARWGGDEFVILHHHAPGEPDTNAVALRIIDEINRAVTIDGSEVIVGASIGSASAPVDGLSPDALLSKADIALYAAKADGRRVWRAFEQAMDTKIQIRRLIELDLRAAVASDAIDVHFQPIVSIATRRIVGFEALARWHHALRGRIAPAEFIPIVEEIGLMEELGAAVLRRACAACAAWPDEISVSVNLSSTQFRNGKLEATILNALSAAKLAPERLDLEITESVLLEDRGGDTRRTLEALRSRGLRISLDDFGTGYSSLSYLLSFPLDRIKIDRTFTMGLGVQERASVVVESVAAMSRRLGMCVLIEGVETAKQLLMIETLGTIGEAQGFLFSPPVPESSIAGLLLRDFCDRAGIGPSDGPALSAAGARAFSRG